VLGGGTRGGKYLEVRLQRRRQKYMFLRRGRPKGRETLKGEGGGGLFREPDNVIQSISATKSYNHEGVENSRCMSMGNQTRPRKQTTSSDEQWVSKIRCWKTGFPGEKAHLWLRIWVNLLLGSE